MAHQSASAASAGRIVFYHPSSTESLGLDPLPAIIVKANGDTLDSVNLQVFGPFQGAILYRAVVPRDIKPGGWTWPIKVMDGRALVEAVPELAVVVEGSVGTGDSTGGQ